MKVKLIKFYFSLNTLFLFIACQSSNNDISVAFTKSAINQDTIIEKYVYNCADNYNYNFPEYQACIDSGLAIDSTIAYLWQQKAMPYFKQMKYSVGMPYLDNAVKYDNNRWLAYRGFIKCIFQKDYKGAIEDFKECIAKYGNSFEMDHTYNFYIGLSHLQLNNFSLAEKIFKKELDSARNLFGTGEEHYLDLFYYGIAKYEQQKWDEAILAFNKALDKYPKFSDAQHYKAISLYRIGKKDAGQQTAEKSIKNKKLGYTINEDNAIYERYPYQLY